MIRAAKYTALLSLLFVLGVLFTVPALAQSQPQQPNNSSSSSTSNSSAPSTTNNIANNVCRGVLITEKNATVSQSTTIDSCQESGDDSFSFLIRRIINIFSIVVGSVSVIMIIIGGFRYIISGGDSSGVSSAKNTILYAIVGLVIVIFAQVIVRFVLSNISPS